MSFDAQMALLLVHIHIVEHMRVESKYIIFDSGVVSRARRGLSKTTQTALASAFRKHPQSWGGSCGFLR